MLADGPAGKAGLKAGDKITKSRAAPSSASDDVRRLPATQRRRDVKLTVRRGKETKEITFKTGEGL